MKNLVINITLNTSIALGIIGIIGVFALSLINCSYEKNLLALFGLMVIQTLLVGGIIRHYFIYDPSSNGFTRRSKLD